MNEEKNIKKPAAMAELCELPYCTSGTMLESKLSHWGRKHSPVSFRRSALCDACLGKKSTIPAAKTEKTSPRVTFTSDNDNRILYFMFFPRMQSEVRLANPLMARPLCESLLSGTNERDTNEGRRPQSAVEGFFRFLLKSET